MTTTVLIVIVILATAYINARRRRDRASRLWTGRKTLDNDVLAIVHRFIICNSMELSRRGVVAVQEFVVDPHGADADNFIDDPALQHLRFLGGTPIVNPAQAVKTGLLSQLLLLTRLQMLWLERVDVPDLDHRVKSLHGLKDLVVLGLLVCRTDKDIPHYGVHIPRWVVERRRRCGAGG